MPVVAASAEEEVLLFEILRLQPILNTRRYLLQFQPFLRFYLEYPTTTPETRDVELFQPFLRFYIHEERGRLLRLSLMVSTLLEILPGGSAEARRPRILRGVSTLLEILG